MINIIVDMSSRPYAISELAAKYEVSCKTIRRMIHAMESINIPVATHSRAENGDLDKVTFRVDRYWIRQFVPVPVMEYWDKWRKGEVR